MGKKTNTYVLEVTTTEENQEALENGNFEEVFEVPEDTKVHLEGHDRVL